MCSCRRPCTLQDEYYKPSDTPLLVARAAARKLALSDKVARRAAAQMPGGLHGRATRGGGHAGSGGSRNVSLDRLSGGHSRNASLDRVSGGHSRNPSLDRVSSRNPSLDTSTTRNASLDASTRSEGSYNSVDSIMVRLTHAEPVLGLSQDAVCSINGANARTPSALRVTHAIDTKCGR